MKQGVVVKLSGIDMKERINNGIENSLNVLTSLDCCEITGFKDSYELRNFESALNNILDLKHAAYMIGPGDDALGTHLDKVRYLRTANEKELNYTIKKQ